MTSIEIEYCVPCGHLDQAQELQRAILTEYGQQVDSVSLVTGDGGIFEVRADGELLYDSDDEGYDETEIVDRVGERASTAA